MTTMIQALETAFVEFDAANAAKSLAWAQGRVVALREFQKSDEYQALRHDSWKLYPRMFNICGGKGWFQHFNYSTADQLIEIMAKNSRAIAEKRNATIVRKLAKIGVTEVGELTYSRTNDGGFNGFFSFQGASIEIRTIGAGGYNIQCYHERTLVYANGKKI